jgi:hypothetical protein
MTICRIAAAASFLALSVALAPCHADTPAATPQAAAKSAARAGLIQGEKFVKRPIVDQQQNGMTAAWVYMPEKWQLQSKIEWHYDWFDNPVVFSCQIQDPASSMAMLVFPQVKLEYLQVPQNLQRYTKPTPPGQEMGNGVIYLQPMQPLAVLELFVKRLRGKEANVKALGQKNLPDLPKALGLTDFPNAQGVGLKISYDLDGKPVEEAFFAVFYLETAHGPGQAAAITQTNWGLTHVHSFRAPAGALDGHMPVFTAMQKSLRPDPAWTLRAQAIQQLLRNKVEEKIKQGYQQLAAAQQIEQQTMANMAQFDKQVAQQTAYLRTSSGGDSGGGGGGRSVNDKFDDNIRGVDTTDDPFWGQSQHSNLESYHWTDGYGNYRDSNDPNYNPSQYESGDWQQMQLSK